MLGRNVMMAAGWPTPLSYRSSVETDNAFAAVNKPAGVAVGDLVIIVGQIGNDTVISTDSGSVWTKNSSADGRLYYKILDATDVANTWSSSVPGLYCVAIAYANAGAAIQSVAVRTSADAGPSVASLSLPGFALSGSGKPRQVIAAITSDNSGNDPVAPTGFTLRVVDISFATAGFADAQQSYTGQAATWTGLTSNVANSYSGWLLEVH